MKSSGHRAPACARRTKHRKRALHLGEAFATAAKYDASLGGLSGRAESRRGRVSAVQAGVIWLYPAAFYSDRLCSAATLRFFDGRETKPELKGL